MNVTSRPAARRDTEKPASTSISAITISVKNTEWAAPRTSRNSTRTATNTKVESRWSTTDAFEVRVDLPDDPTADDQRVSSRAELLPEEQAAGSEATGSREYRSPQPVGQDDGPQAQQVLKERQAVRVLPAAAFAAGALARSTTGHVGWWVVVPFVVGTALQQRLDDVDVAPRDLVPFGKAVEAHRQEVRPANLDRHARFVRREHPRFQARGLEPEVRPQLAAQPIPLVDRRRNHHRPQPQGLLRRRRQMPGVPHQIVHTPPTTQNPNRF